MQRTRLYDSIESLRRYFSLSPFYATCDKKTHTLVTSDEFMRMGQMSLRRAIIMKSCFCFLCFGLPACLPVIAFFFVSTVGRRLSNRAGKEKLVNTKGKKKPNKTTQMPRPLSLVHLQIRSKYLRNVICTLHAPTGLSFADGQLVWNVVYSFGIGRHEHMPSIEHNFSK